MSGRFVVGRRLGRGARRDTGETIGWVAVSKSVELALDVLESLGRRGVPTRLTELAEELDQPKATMYRALATLQQRGYVGQLRDERYRLDVRCVELGAQAADALDLREVARPELEALNQLTQENVHLAVYAGGDVVYVDVVVSPQPVAPKSRVGTRAPSTAVATGRALLAFQSPAEIERVLRGPLEPFTPASITDASVMGALLEQVRQEGVATNEGSWREGVCGVAAPIRDHTSVTIASVGCCVPDVRFSRERRQELASAVLATADRISQRIGYPLPRMRTP